MADAAQIPDEAETRARWGAVFALIRPVLAEAGELSTSWWSKGNVMRTLIVSLVVLIAAPAQSEEPQQKYAQVAAKVANAIYAGETLDVLGSLPKLSDAELAELSKLAGCKATLRPNIDKNYVSFNWACDAGTPSNLQRSTTMRFSDSGEMFDFAINPVVETFAPTATALSMVKMPRKKGLVKQFAQAVVDGNDPTVGGIIPLTELQREQLSHVTGRRITIYGDDDERVLLVWQIKSTPGDGDISATVYFNVSGQPTGVLLENSSIRIQRFTTSEPL